MSDIPSPVIEAVLSKLKHLDLGDRISNVKPELKFRGGYGDVFVGTILQKDGRGQMKVSMKQLRVSLCDAGFAKSFAKEISIWARLQHKNIVHLEGFIREGGFPTLVSVWADKGSLRGYIRACNEYNSVQMVSGIADGLAYLHSLDVVHSDLKSDNVLVDDFEQPMICDFGISRMLSYSQSILASTSYETLRGSLRWMAYELLLVDEDSTISENLSIKTNTMASLSDEDLDDTRIPMHTKETDMWAFGMVVFEIISRKLPFSNIRSDFNVLTAIRNKQLPKKPKEMDLFGQELWKLCLRCWNFSPGERIGIKEAIDMLALIPNIQESSSSHTSLPSVDAKPSTHAPRLKNEPPPMIPSSKALNVSRFSLPRQVYGAPALPKRNASSHNDHVSLISQRTSRSEKSSIMSDSLWNITLPKSRRNRSRISVGGSMEKRSGTPAAEYLRWAEYVRWADGPVSPSAHVFNHRDNGRGVEFVGDEGLDFEFHDYLPSNQEGFEGLENVRSCCDGLHTVGRGLDSRKSREGVASLFTRFGTRRSKATPMPS